MTTKPAPMPEFDLRYGIEAKDHFVKVSEWLVSVGMDKEWEVVLPKPNQLFLDYDFPDKMSATPRLETVLKTIEETYNLSYDNIQQTWTVSKSGNLHCVITLPDGIQMHPFQIAAWQAAAGSDHKRESLHVKSIAMGSKNPNLLVERKQA